MKRREFLAGLGLGTYSLCVRVDGLEAATTGQEPRTGDAFARIAPPDEGRTPATAEPHMTQVALECDVLVAGGGMAGVCAAVAAARHGAKVVLVQDRSRLGGNASSEVKMHIVGASNHKGRPGWRESGLLEEFRLDDAVNNPQRSWELWDLLLYDKVMSEPNITLLLDSVLFAAVVQDGRITTARVRCDKTEHLYEVTAKIFLDCTGDSRLALEAGATMRHGREPRSTYGEPLAPILPDRETLGSSILFTARDYGKPMPFAPPKWARKVSKEQLKHRKITSWEYGYWWIEWGGSIDTIRDNERIRYELVRIVMGVWDHIKNSGEHPTSANWALDWVGMLPGKRESRRILGDHVLTQGDLMGLRSFDDAVAIGGWPMDDHSKMDFDHSDVPPYNSIKVPIYNIPLRSLYSKDLSNLMMAGRNISASHVAFTSTRVMGTCSVMGQAAGTAAALCVQAGKTPRELYADKPSLRRLQQVLLRDDQTIAGVLNSDPDDLARQATVTASGETPETPAALVIDGITRDIPGESIHRWTAPISGEGAWIELAWNESRPIRQVQLVFDSGFQRELTLTSQDGVNKGIIRVPQPETVRDYQVLYRPAVDADWSVLAEVRDNHQRRVVHEFDPVKIQAVRVRITATNGAPDARVFEVRCYA